MQQTYGFIYPAIDPHLLYRIYSIGWQKISQPTYQWDGRLREGSGWIFQYTLSGTGFLTSGGNTYAVAPGYAFLVQIPDEHRYYYDPHSEEPWEFLWIRLQHPSLAAAYPVIHEALGYVFACPPDAEPIRKLWQLYHSMDTESPSKLDKYAISELAYSWLLALLRWSSGERRTETAMPANYKAAMDTIHRRYHEAISLQELAEVAGTTRTHFCKQFHKLTGITPHVYVRNLRIQKAAELLRRTELSIADIASRTGFDNTSYFGKVFRSLIGVTPSDYRSGMHDYADQLVFIEE
jgi:AraC-like DNA-binding protein